MIASTRIAQFISNNSQFKLTLRLVTSQTTMAAKKFSESYYLSHRISVANSLKLDLSDAFPILSPTL